MGEHPTPEHILQVGLGFWASKTLLSAVEMGVFTELARHPGELEQVRRRLGLHADAENVEVPVVYVMLPNLVVQEATLTYSSGPDGIHVLSPVSSATITVDTDGFVVDYPGLSERI